MILVTMYAKGCEKDKIESIVVLKGDSIKNDTANINTDEICFCFVEFINPPTFRCIICLCQIGDKTSLKSILLK